MSEIVVYNAQLAQLRTAVAQLDTVDEARELADKAAAAQKWAERARLGKDAVNHAAEIKLRAERRAGQILTEHPEYGPGKKSVTGTDLGIDENQSRRWQELGRIDDEQFDKAMDALEDITRKGVIRYARTNVDDLPTPETPPLPTGRFRCIVIDPPWPVEKIVRDVRPQTRVLEYSTMSLDEIAALDIPTLADPAGCHVYLWVTHKFLPEGLRFFDEWGVKYQCVMTWVKNVGMTPFSWMYSTEHVLYGTAGSLPLLRMGLRLDFAERVQGHSVKPDAFYERVLAASPEPRLEMFARRERDGFLVWGNEVADVA